MKGIQRILHTKWVQISLGAVLALTLLFFFIFIVNWGMSHAKREALLETGTFVEGVRIGGVDVSGKTMAEAKEEVLARARKLLKRTVVRFRVGDIVYRLSGSQLGTLIDYEAVMEQAMLYGRDGSLLSDLRAKHAARKNGVDFELDVLLDKSVLESTIKEMSTTFNSTVQDAQTIVDVSKTAATYQVQSKIYAADAVVGRAVDIRNLIDAIVDAVEQDATSRTIVAKWEETQPGSSDADSVMTDCQKIGAYTTSLSQASAAQLANAWKAGGLLSGLQVAPGESVSVLSVLGDMTEEEGWQTAEVIGSDNWTEEVGGGASQVASTLYAALLQAEVQVDARTHHAWAPDYIAPGLDARLCAAENADLVFKNPYDKPIYILVQVDGSKEKMITVEVYGAPLGYTVEITANKFVDSEPTKAAVVQVDESQEAGYSAWIKPRKNLVKVDIWKVHKNAETGEQIGERLYIEEVTYDPLPGEQVVGPEAQAPADTTDTPTDSTGGAEGEGTAEGATAGGAAGTEGGAQG